MFIIVGKLVFGPLPAWLAAASHEEAIYLTQRLEDEC
jgi:hypothetical protein